MSHVHEAQDVTWQCGKCRQMRAVFAAPDHFAFPGISKSLSFGRYVDFFFGI